MQYQQTYKPNNQADNKDAKFDTDKNRLDLIEPEFIEGLGEVLTFGAKKYGPNTWQTIADPENRYYGAALRHLMAYRKGEHTDSESGLSHLKHCAVNLMYLLHFEEVKNE